MAERRSAATIRAAGGVVWRFRDGRLEIGLGAGWMRSDYDQAGLHYDSAGPRIERLGEPVAVLNGLFAADPFSHRGTHHRLEAVPGLPNPAQPPQPPPRLPAVARRGIGRLPTL